MRIGINLVRYQNKRSGGNFVYAKNVVAKLIELKKDSVIVIFCSDIELCRQLFEIPEGPNVRLKAVKKINSLLDMHFLLRKECRLEQIDLFFSPSHLLPLIKPECKTLLAIMDLNFKHFSQGFLKDIYKEVIYSYSILNADYIVTISNFTMNDIIINYRINQAKIAVTYCGLDSKTGNDNHLINEPYFLAFGHHEHKNAGFLLQVMYFLKNTGRLYNSKLVVVGLRQKSLLELTNMAKQLGIYEMCVFLDFISDGDLADLYKNATAFLFPSKFEGFGLPLIEAMSHKCPVIASNCGSIPEVIGEAGIVINEFSKQIWAETIFKIIQNEDLRKELIQKGLKRAAEFTWGKNVNKLVTIIDELVIGK